MWNLKKNRWSSEYAFDSLPVLRSPFGNLLAGNVVSDTELQYILSRQLSLKKYITISIMTYVKTSMLFYPASVDASSASLGRVSSRASMESFAVSRAQRPAPPLPLSSRRRPHARTPAISTSRGTRQRTGTARAAGAGRCRSGAPPG